MSDIKKTRETLLIAEIEWLRSRLAEPEATVAAIRNGQVDAFVVSEKSGERVYTLKSADPPYRLMVEEMREGAATIDRDGIILYANGRLAELLGRSVEVLRGSSVSSFVAREDLPTLKELLGGGQGGRGEISLRRADGELLPVQVATNLLDTDETSIHCLVLTDLTDQKRLAALAASEEARREADRRKDEFLAMLGHELRNPLAAIANAVQLLRDSSPDAGRVEWARDLIERQVQQLARMVDDLLDVSRIATGKIELRRVVVDLRSLVSRAVDSHRRAIEQGGRALTVSLPDEETPVAIDPDRFVQVVTNLLGNALKFTKSGDRISVTLTRDSENILMRVADTGAGIPPEMLENIFELFTQLDRPGGRPNGGLGIGLALSRRLLDLQDGTITACSAGPGCGSEFVVRLPIASPSSFVALASTPTSVAPSSRRVLVVEDHVDSAEGLAALLTLNGHEVRTTNDGPSALAACTDFRPDAVLLDIGLPGMDGYEVARRLRSSLGADVLLVALTGFGQDEDRRRSADAGIDHHLLKPVRPDRVEELLTRRFASE